MIALPFRTPPFTVRFDGGEIVGRGVGGGGEGVIVFVPGREFVLVDGVTVSSGVGDGVGLGDGFGVGVGVFKFAFEFEFALALVLKLKLLSRLRFVFSSRFAFGRLELTLAFEFTERLCCRI